MPRQTVPGGRAPRVDDMAPPTRHVPRAEAESPLDLLGATWRSLVYRALRRASARANR
jgi:hypothetical protein